MQLFGVVELQIFSLFHHLLRTTHRCLLCLSPSNAARGWRRRRRRWWWSARTPLVHLSCVITHRLSRSRDRLQARGRWLCETMTLMEVDKHRNACREKEALGREPWATSAFARFPPQTSTLKTSLLLALLATGSSGQLKGRFKEDSEEKT